MSHAPTLETERLILRPWRDADRRVFAEMNADPKVMKYFPHLLTVEQSDAMVERIIENWRHGYGLWAVENSASNNFIGFIGFSSPRWEAPFTPCIEIGWRLAADSWNQGFATEGAEAALAWGRDNVQFPRGEVVSFTTLENWPSRRVMEKLGMEHDPDDDFDHPLLSDWERRRHVLYRLSL
jgi:RimJ/RimL family protein N-acetyltransferase